MKDTIIRATAANGQIRAFAAITTKMVSYSQHIHNLYPVATAAMGRTMTAAVMMAAEMKGEQNVLSIIVKGNGPLGNTVVVANSKGKVKGYVGNPSVDIPLKNNGKLDVSEAVGTQGNITIIKDLGLKDPYIGQVNIISGEIGEDIANYYLKSEQQPSAVALGVLINPDITVKAAGGYIIQPMPGTPMELIEDIENCINKNQSISSMIDEGMDCSQILEAVLGAHSLSIKDEMYPYYECDCNRERLEGVLISLGEDELLDIIHTDKKAELVCHYCNQKYVFNEEELVSILNKAKA